MQWIGDGVFSHEGKDYGYGDELPENINKKTLKRLEKLGCVGDIPKAIKPVNVDLQAKETEIEQLKEEQLGLLRANDELQKDHDALKTSNDELQKKLEKLEKKLKKKDK